MEHADRFLRRFYIEKGMFGSLSLTFIFYRPPLILRKYQVPKACLGRLVTLARLISASATVAEDAVAEKIGAG